MATQSVVEKIIVRQVGKGNKARYMVCEHKVGKDGIEVYEVRATTDNLAKAVWQFKNGTVVEEADLETALETAVKNPMKPEAAKKNGKKKAAAATVPAAATK